MYVESYRGNDLSVNRFDLGLVLGCGEGKTLRNVRTNFQPVRLPGQVSCGPGCVAVSPASSANARASSATTRLRRSSSSWPLPRADQIGRASCRERVCPYV